MSSTKQLKRRIKSVSNISQITKAMEMVSASKMRQAQLQALASRTYSRKLDDILSQLAEVIDTSYHQLLQAKPAQKEAILILSTDRGLTGSLNTNLFKTVSSFQQSKPLAVYTLGRLAREFTVKSGLDLKAHFGAVPDKLSYEEAVPIAALLIKEFTAATYSRVWIAYMDFVSTLSQTPRIAQLLPIQKTLETQPDRPMGLHKEYLFEPDPQTLLNWILPYSVELTIYQSLLKARASEHSARMVAMKNASENASELVDNLQLIYNRGRQANITGELLDIITASSTLS